VSVPTQSTLPPVGGAPAPWTGAACMLLAVLCFTLLDAIAKRMVSSVNPLLLAWGRYAFSLLPLLLLVPPLFGWRRLATAQPGLQIARGLTLIGATAAMFAGLRVLPLSDAYALSYVAPVLVAVLSRFAFAEQLNRRQWAALALGFAGVLVAIRPAFAQAGGVIVFPLLMAASYATYQVLTRSARRTDDAMACVFYASLVGAALLTLALPFVWSPMPLAYWGWLAAMGGLGVAGHWLLAVAANRASPSLLAPLSYAQLVYAALLDLALFGTVPDRWTLTGSSIIVLGGLLLWRAAPRVQAFVDTSSGPR
jgi:drug/metabolite transporter (DMT)-like permease